MECQGKNKQQYPDSATPIYPSTTYCKNAKKLRTRERTWTRKKNNASTGKKGMEKIIDYAKEIGLYNGI
jgi:hypothetical protein